MGAQAKGTGGQSILRMHEYEMYKVDMCDVLAVIEINACTGAPPEKGTW